MCLILENLRYFLGNCSHVNATESIDDVSTLVQVMAWCRQATSHYLNQCWPRFISPYNIFMPQGIKYGIVNNKTTVSSARLRLSAHKRHPIFSPQGPAVGCLYWDSWPGLNIITRLHSTCGCVESCIFVTHWGCRIGHNLTNSFSSAFSWKKKIIFKFQGNSFLMVILQKIRFGTNNGLVLNRQQAITWTNDYHNTGCTYAYPGLNPLNNDHYWFNSRMHIP